MDSYKQENNIGKSTGIVLRRRNITRRTTGAQGKYFLQVFTIFYKYHRASILD